MASQKVFTGDRFGEWTVIEYSPRKSLCRCSCGIEKIVQNSNLTKGNNNRCQKCSGAYRASLLRKVCKDLELKVYLKLRQAVDNAYKRCYKESHPQYKDYGARGIKVIFKDKDEFTEYLSILPGHDNLDLVLDRLDNNQHYRAGNLRFTTSSISNLNRREFGSKLLHDSNGDFRKKG